MKKIKYASFIVMIFAAVVILARIIVPVVMGFNSFKTDGAPIGIIGGADGPTVIYVAEKSLQYPVVAIVILIASFAVWLTSCKQLKRNS